MSLHDVQMLRANLIIQKPTIARVAEDGHHGRFVSRANHFGWFSKDALPSRKPDVLNPVAAIKAASIGGLFKLRMSPIARPELNNASLLGRRLSGLNRT
ncbi:hypothetical protein [Bradyrhizobium sp. ARR65]|uniref:hypothetical protein n=1 Tax=Bradyrhizobium sp. ARR65 TaxID=1040989 RepID=UPI0004640467|nr:hypothetical protein [Bradyrhizobium sp. ARR65]